ncbi:AI-2E family transporter [Desulfovibrio mangrovi]|uniref:AI-2E family transporter n=1 Tax=Desulfovibrio mangrovi TaxID=2976983 RepID=UPI002245E435|nr:AI-2E family transporter [Desulfovibrio mangrovi]UZP67900.1 AI-2E family transporter [Desulfovibrio mangrovi]
MTEQTTSPAENTCEQQAQEATSPLAQFSRTFSRQGLYGYFLIILVLLSLYLMYGIIRPFMHTGIIAIVIAACFSPLYNRILQRMGNRELLASGAVIGILVVCFALPVTVFLSGLIPQAIDSIRAVNDWLRITDFDQLTQQSGILPAIQWLQQKLPFIDPLELDIKHNITLFSKSAGQTVISFATSALGDTVTFFFHFLLMLLIIFFLLKDGKKMLAAVKYLCPMREEQEDNIINTLRQVSRSVLVGGLLVAVLQGIVGGFGLAMVGIPALFWGTVMGFCSLIPVVGTGLVWIPACLYLLIVGEWQSSIFLLLWCALPVAAIDSFLRPYFMKDSARVSVFFIFMSILGGIKAFGILGILYGPLILSFTMVMLTIYGEEFADVLGEKPPAPAKKQGK